MATIDYRKGAVGDVPSYTTNRRAWVEEIILDFSATNSGAGDTNQLFNVPAGVRVDGVAWEVITAEGGTLTFDIGDTATTDGYVNGADGDTVARGSSDEFSLSNDVSGRTAYTDAIPITVSPAFGLGKVYDSDDVISLITVNAADTAKIQVIAYGVDLTNRD